MMIKKIYSISPVLIQNVFCTLYGYVESRKRFTRSFFKYLDELIVSDYFSSNEIVSLKKQKLSSSLNVAKGTKKYTALREFTYSDINLDPFSVLSELPILTKDELRRFDFSFLDNCHEIASTSGTTGKSLTVPRCKSLTAYQWAVWFRHRHRFGVSYRDLSVNFTGKPVIPLDYKGKVYWRYNAAQRQYLISMQSINKSSITSIVSFLNSIKPTFYSGYPSIIYQLVSLASEEGLFIDETSKPNVLFLGAEKTIDYQKDAFVNWFGVDCLISDQYGLTEANCNFSKCEFGVYHEDYEFSHIELVDAVDNGDGTRTGKLVGTSLQNNCLPLIRYFTGDIATFADENYRCPCGRSSQVILSVDGRNDDFIITTDNRKIMRLDYLFKNTNEVIEAQIVQEQLGSILIKAVPSTDFDQRSFEDKVSYSVCEYIDRRLKVEFSYVDNILRSSTGKFKAVVNRLGWDNETNTTRHG